MSLIHKALKKADGGEDKNAVTNEPPIEAFIGEQNSLKSQLTPRTVLLLVLAILALCFTIYKRIHPKQPPTAAFAPKADFATPANPVPAVMPEAPQDAAVDEGKKMFVEGKYDDALAKFVEANSRNPSNPVVFNNIGLIYKKKNDFAQAEGYYKRALALKPDYPECLNNLGVLKAASGDSLSASVYLKKAVSLDQKYADAYFNLAVLNDGEGNFREAISNYKSFLTYTDTKDNTLVSSVKERIEELSE